MAPRAYFIPLWSQVMNALGFDRTTAPSDANRQARDVALLSLRKLIERSPFNEADYLARNPDVKRAIADRVVNNGQDHFVRFGFEEGRIGGINRVDAEWYLFANPDVESAVSSNKFKSAADHYYQVGILEWRPLNAEVAGEVGEWRLALSP
jgi:hypothetical protein